MQIKLKYVLIVTAILLFVVGGLIWYVSYLNQEIQNRENTIAVQRQNAVALQDYITMQADSMQDYAIFVKDLQTENVKLEKKYVLLKTKYNILLDSIAILNGEADVDTSDNMIKISFDSTYKKITFEGYTLYYKATGKGTYSLKIAIAPSTIESEIYLDEETKLIRNKIFVDGALIGNAITQIDSMLYILLKQNELQCPDEPTFFDRLHLLTEIGTQIEQENGIYMPKKVYLPIGIEYQFDKFRIFGKFDVINQDINAGIQYHPSVKDIWKAIF